MKPVTIMEDEFAGLWYHPDSKLIHHEIRRFLPRGFFRKVLTTGAEYLEKHGAQKWLSDDRLSVVIAEEDVRWGDTVWAPRVIEAGFRYWAVVIPASEVAARQMEGFVRGYREQGVTVAQFESVCEALAWLESV
jgi:hypothetical protein